MTANNALNTTTLTATAPAPKSRTEAWVAFEAAQLALEQGREEKTNDRKEKELKKFRINLRKVGALRFAHGFQPMSGRIKLITWEGKEEWAKPPVVGKYADAGDWVADQGWFSKYVINVEEDAMAAFSQLMTALLDKRQAGDHTVSPYPDYELEKEVAATQPLVEGWEVERLVRIVSAHTFRREVGTYKDVAIRALLVMKAELDPEGRTRLDRLRGRPSAWRCKSKQELFEHLVDRFAAMNRLPRIPPVGMEANMEAFIRAGW